MHKSTLQWFTTIIQAASVFPPCDNSRSSCTFSRTFPALRFQVESYKYYIFYFEIYMEFICLLSVYLYVKRYFRGKPQTSFGILISIGDTSRKENIVKPLFQQLLVFLPAALHHRHAGVGGAKVDSDHFAHSACPLFFGAEYFLEYLTGFL